MNVYLVPDEFSCLYEMTMQNMNSELRQTFLSLSVTVGKATGDLLDKSKSSFINGRPIQIQGSPTVGLINVSSKVGVQFDHVFGQLKEE